MKSSKKMIMMVPKMGSSEEVSRRTGKRRDDQLPHKSYSYEVANGITSKLSPLENNRPFLYEEA